MLSHNGNSEGAKTARRREANHVSKSEACRRFQQVLAKDGTLYTTKGFPDVLAFDRQGKVLGAFYVTTGRRRRLRRRQQDVALGLIKAGIHCQGWAADRGWFPIDDDTQANDAADWEPWEEEP